MPASAATTAAAHGRTPSQVSVPELRLTTDVEDNQAMPASSAMSLSPSARSRSRSGSGAGTALSFSPAAGAGGTGIGAWSGSHAGADAGGSGAAAATTSVPQMYTPPPSSPSSVSRLHLSKVTDPSFWSALHSFLEFHFQTSNAPPTSAQANPNAMAVDQPPPSSSPSTTPSTTRPQHSRTTSLSILHARSPGENEVQRLWEDFFLSQKRHLSSSEVARVRDETGMLGLAGV
ncbi:hypothetical protein K437DRAFT_258579 [Tilletiaria anomala UBC 951]|uniref:Uncharacterized protein n=1 Tax=Tilletiaria anomala (strain ATCC 24038 / CBS 436.72 / UBC 951) TaxID=1037660 RepID=A0A066VK65_TILAU|nr:uncharacterized protein K437DRAFT_258579 [Tilletiaria anomala UBC 951]KDN40708.1 hypothetical protein K437DRAFT_258579 [Tilletiaria anomala UBC 951]